MSTEDKSFLSQAKPFIWGLIIGAGIWWGALAWGFGWMSHGAAHQLADQQSQNALVAAVAPECVARFEHQTGVLKAWQALKKSSDNYDQASFLEKGGWVAMKGQTIPSSDNDAIANHCANKLLSLKQVGKVKLTSATS